MTAVDVDAVLAPHGDAPFWPIEAPRDTPGAGHAPFLAWLVAAIRPARIVSLAPDVAFLAALRAAERAGIPATSGAVATASLAPALRAALDPVDGFVWLTPAELRPAESHHAGIDLLHTGSAAWDPAWLSARGVVVGSATDDTALFVHDGGLSVRAVGPDVPEALLRLQACADPAGLRARFAGLGRRWTLEAARAAPEPANRAELRSAIARAVAADAQSIAAIARAATAEARLVASEARLAETAARAATDLAAARQAAVTAGAEAAQAEHRAETILAALDAARRDAASVRAAFATVAGSHSWRLTQRLRRTAARLRARPVPPTIALPPPVPPPPVPPPPVSPPLLPSPPAPAAAAAPMPVAERPPSAAAQQRRRVLFVAGEPDTPGCTYRVLRATASAAEAGWQARWIALDRIDGPDLVGVDVVVLWRTAWSEHVHTLIRLAHAAGARIGLDLDDLMIRPELARAEFIDAIRVMDWSEARVAALFEGVAVVMANVDFCVATTDELAADMRSAARAAYVVPNGFDEASRLRARTAARRGRPSDGLVRIGYAGGSRTHQRDFAAIVGPLAAVLRARPYTRLVLFRDAAGRGVLLADEFPELRDLADRIEWRSMVPLDELPDELARFDINLAPLEAGNPFVEAKSELKYFEAALAGTCTIASPTAPYRRAIADGVTGLLCETPAQWEAALFRLVDDPAARARLARAAYHDSLWRFGPQRRGDAWRFVLEQQRAALGHDAAAAARDFARELHRARGPAIPEVRETETLFRHDAGHEAPVSVVVASFNYADYIQQALDSARVQSLPVIDLIVVDDASTDPDTVDQLLEWARTHAPRFNRMTVLRHRVNAGLGATRNAGIAAAETPHVLLLDADNRLLPDAAARLLAAIGDAAFAYPRLRTFGDTDREFGAEPWEPQRLVATNHVDAMALVAKWAWAAAGGYYVQRDAMGWEDYGLWCRLAELGLPGVAVPEVLAEYRQHGASMVNSIMETPDTKPALVALMERRHPWLRIRNRVPRQRR